MQWLLTRKVWLLNTRKVHLAHFLKKVDIVRFNSKPSICTHGYNTTASIRPKYVLGGRERKTLIRYVITNGHYVTNGYIFKYVDLNKKRNI